MKYSISSMRHELELIGFDRSKNPFIFENNPEIRVDREISEMFYKGKRYPNYLNDLVEYCWHAYGKSYSAAGRRYIGRIGDLWKDELLKQVRVNISQGDNLWRQGTSGNILIMDKWSLVLNDCWILGGVHRYADFEMMSVEAPANFWDHDSNRLVVTAREIFGLIKFGYRRQKKGALVVYRCEDKFAADSATLLSYDKLMRNLDLLGSASVTKLIHERASGFDREIMDFSLNKLKAIRI